jgi:hypothetical protein
VKEFEKSESFTKYGFVIIRDLLSPQMVEKLRAFIQKKMALLGHKRQMISCQTYLFPELYLLQFEERAVNMLKKVLGENLCYFPDLTVQHNMFGYPGWHMDSNSEGYAKYLQAPDYKFAKCGIYLQDDTLGWGGGIKVLPKGHKLSTMTGAPRIDLRVRRLLDFCSIKYSFPIKPLRVDTKAGDMLIFDSRLLHASTIPQKIDELKKVLDDNHFLGIPREHEKIVVYWDASNSKMKNDFLKNATKRAKKEESGDELFYTGWTKHYFPDDFSDDLISKTRELGVEVGCLGEQECQEMKLQFEEKMN